jgi:hypothetical protein
MKKVVFLRPAPYSDKLVDQDVISSFDSIGLQISDPDIYPQDLSIKRSLNILLEKIRPTKVYSSPATRCIKTAELLGLPFEISSQLKEIPFSLSESLPVALLSKINPDINELRIELIKAFVDNKTKESPTEVLNRILVFRNNISNVEGNIICISHAFVMKFYEIFFQNNEKITNVRSFLNDYNWRVKPYEFLDGFYVSFDNKGNISVIEPVKNLLI